MFPYGNMMSLPEVNAPVLGLNWSFVELVYSVDKLPVVWFANNGYLVALVDVSSVTVA